MIIELRGVEFTNKGAELMLHAIMGFIRDRLPEAVFVMDRGARVPLDKLKQHNIQVKLNGRRFSRFGKFVPRLVRRKFRYILDQEIDIVMDGSGFAFGDQWGSAYAERRLGANIVKWKQQGKKIILLPQAFGPFQDPRLKEVMKRILLHTDLVFARELQSYHYLKEIAPESRCMLAPDFTNLVKGQAPTDFDKNLHQVAVIPNYKMIEKTDQYAAYFSFLLRAIREVAALGLRPYFLIHEGEKDRRIAEMVNGYLLTPIPIVSNDDPVKIKGIIASAYFVICSRFHGAVSALSQAIPCLVTSWSHKYEMLLHEYGFEEGLIENLDDPVSLRELIRRMADPECNQLISGKLATSSEKQKVRSMEMWEVVFNAINQ
ncbi:MAG: polysaccharide pyruvyl transferase family protein [Solitalea sp.]